MCDVLFNFFRIYSSHLHNLLTVTLRRLNWIVLKIQSNLNYEANQSNKVFYYNIFYLLIMFTTFYVILG